ncbi:MAG TPA: MmcQ/YjbR family DNA-binding protein [Candidatus Acidoferrales bacterium]|nr:MmcQ/YjbR family DNA-binding protein [Candidatus Acidoferrales bacterium]
MARITVIALALPSAARKIHGDHAAFLVRKKPFAYFLNNHHGDGIISIAGKVLPGDNSALAAAQPKRFYLPAYIGPRGWVALRLDRGKIDWEEVAELLRTSYLLLAPKTLARLVDPSTRLARANIL